VPSVLVFLKKSFCGFEGKSTKVCCPLENNVAPVAPAVASVTMATTVKPIALNNGAAKLPSQSRCGLTNVTRSRIIGGTPAELG